MSKYVCELWDGCTILDLNKIEHIQMLNILYIEKRNRQKSYNFEQIMDRQILSCSMEVRGVQ
jgi:hypothetical protein